MNFFAASVVADMCDEVLHSFSLLTPPTAAYCICILIIGLKSLFLENKVAASNRIIKTSRTQNEVWAISKVLFLYLTVCSSLGAAKLGHALSCTSNLIPFLPFIYFSRCHYFSSTLQAMVVMSINC